MADKKTRADNIHDQMPALYNTRANDNWKALVESLGDVDQETLDLVESVRQQFFIKTASRPYLDRLGTANLVQRPRFVGMDDPTFREFIPVMSYQPKQVKLIMDKLLDIFFFKESTTSFISSGLTAPFNLEDEWELEYNVDNFVEERIEFRTEEFTDIDNATADEVVAAINRQATNSYAIAFEDSITKLISIRIFTNTVGSKGSVRMTGGRANIGLQFDGYNTNAGNGIGTEWNVDKVGDTVTLTYTGTGGSPNIDQLQVGDVVIITRPGNEGSFTITDVDATNNTIQYLNLFATNETFVQDASNDVKFMTPLEANVYLRDRRAVVWEVKPGEIIVEMPPTPPVVQRRRIGSAHINGIESLVTATPTTDSLTLANADKFPDTGGRFFFAPLNEIQTYHPADMATDVHQFKSKLSSCLPVYTYTGKTGSTLEGISPALPTAANTTPINLVSANRDNNNTITVTTTTPHDYKVGDYVVIEDAVLGAAPDPNEQFRTTFAGDMTIADIAGGSNVGTIGGAGGSIVGGKFVSGGAAYIDYDKAGNWSPNVGTIRFKYTPDFTGFPPNAFNLLYHQALSVPALGNSIFINWSPTGNVAIYMSDNLNVPFVNSSIGGPVAGVNGVEQEWELNYDVPGGTVRLFVDGVEIGTISGPFAGSQVDTAAAGVIRLGSGTTGSPISGSFDDLQIFTNVQHTSDFAGEIPRTLASVGGGTGLDVNGTWKITNIISDTEFEVYSFSGPFGEKLSTGGTVRIERIGTSDAGSRVILTTAQIEEGLEGPFLWDENSDFVLSSLTTNLTAEIEAGTTQRNILVDPNDIPNESGRLIFDFGTEKQEGPVRYFFKPSDTSLALDPSYVFQFSHDVGSSVTMIRRRGGIEFAGVGEEYAGYITDPAAAREVLQELMEEVKSVGIFINFLIRYPEQFYATIDVYRSGVDPG